jgi:quinoprotein glucose dehydrogenase
MRRILITSVIGAALVAQGLLTAQSDSNWVYFQGDQAGTRYSTLTQIDTSNVRNLERAWTFHTGDDGGFFESTPMVIDSVMYFGTRQGIFSLDAVTGQQRWKYDTTGTARRGPAYWPGGNGVAPRIFSGSENGMIALDARTGTLITTFGENGAQPETGNLNSPPAIYQNLLFTQSVNTPAIRAWDAITGRLVWTWHTKPQPGDPNLATWFGDSATTTRGPGMWGVFTVDAERGILFVPVEKVGNNYYGGSHHGNNLYSDSLVALEATTGRMLWFQQLVHHDIWDYDIAAAPTLVDVVQDGRTIPAVVQMNKMGLMFIFNRLTGEPIFGMEERPVPQTTAIGEWTSPTQPFPIKPGPLARNSMTRAELAKVTPEHEAFCASLWEKYDLRDSVPYQPWENDRDIVVFPGAIGGGNWQGTTFNKALGLIITNTMSAGQWGRLAQSQPGGGRGGGRGAGAAAGQAAGGRGAAGDAPATAPAAPATGNWGRRTPEQGRFWDGEKRWSCAEPPWGELIAVNANTGDIAWRVTLGNFDELEALGIKAGAPSLGGAMTTAGNLVFIGATVDSKFRAFDARTGEELWVTTLDAPGHAIPSTYMGRDGKQYVVIPAGGGTYLDSETSDSLIAYALP